ncbi:MAG: PHP domain-containing protein [Rectinema sp.]|nr:PHP domain-containing protein [Rectinema sp.]
MKERINATQGILAHAFSRIFEGSKVLRDAANKLEDPAISPNERLDALSTCARILGKPKARSGISNNHIHTCYSFSPYTPASAALAARLAGLEAAGSVDHDTLAAAEELKASCTMLGLGSVTGFELRVSLKETAKHLPEPAARMLLERKLNNPDSAGIIYITVQGVPASAREEVSRALLLLRQARAGRTRAMTQKASAMLQSVGLEGIEFERDVAGISLFAKGGTITERHLLAAVSRRILETFNPGPELVNWLEHNLAVTLSTTQKHLLSDPSNHYAVFDLLGVLKAEVLERFFIQPDEECPDVREILALSKRIGAIAAYAYLGDITESPTGDKKAEKFEDEVLDTLFPVLKEIGFQAITYMPPRNTRAQLSRVRRLCQMYDFMEISGVDINQPRQSFDCPELKLPEFRHLDDATWAMVAHEALSAIDPRFGIFAEDNPLCTVPLAERIRRYAAAGRTIDLSRTSSLEHAASTLSERRVI